MSSRRTRIVERYLAISERYGMLILTSALLLAAAGGYGATRLRVDARLERLLPGETPSARAVAELRARTSVEGPLYLLVTSPDPKVNRQIARQLLHEVERWPETIWAIDRRDPAFFREHALLFAPTDRLEELTDDVEWLVDWEECDALPLCINLYDRPPEPTREDVVALFEGVPAVETLAALLDVQVDTLFGEAGEDTNGGESRSGELCNSDATVCAVQAVLNQPASDVEFSTLIFERCQALISRVAPPSAPPDLRVVVAGTYRILPMTQAIVRDDLKRAAVLGGLLVCVALLIMFRGARAFAVLLGPIVVSVLWSLGIVGLVHPNLNLISASVLALLLGLGVDFGVHVLMKYGAFRHAGSAPRDALQRSMETLLGPMTVAAVTTGTAFAALSAARFRGFAEMGPLGALGISLAFLAFVLLVPPLVLMLHRISPERHSPLRLAPRVPRRRKPAIATFVTFGGIAIAVALGLFGASHLELERDFRSLRPEEIDHGVRYGDALHGTLRTAVFIMADDPEELERVADEIRASETREQDDTRFEVVTPRSFTPPEQEDRLALIARLRDASERAEKRASNESADRIREIEPYLDIREPISASDLPAWARGSFAEKDGTFGRLGIWYAGGSTSDVGAMEQLAHEIQQRRERHPDVRFASTPALLGEVVPGLKRDGPVVIGLALLALLLTTLLVARSIRRTLVVGATIAMAAGVCAGLVPLLDLKIDLYNMLVFPVAFGVGVDGAIYLAWLYDREGTDLSRPNTTARAVLGSTLTDAAAFGALGTALYPGLVSVSKVALVALGSALVANLVWLPAAFQWRKRDGS
jgi:predicted RND superfamily exporter protein